MILPRLGSLCRVKGGSAKMTIELTESEVTSLKIALTASYAAFLGSKKEIVDDAKSDEQFLTLVGDISRVLFKLK